VKRAKKAKPKAQGRISPTEALTIMQTRMAAPLGAKRLTEAMHDWKRPCRLWRDGKLVSRAEVAHLSLLESADDADPDRWHASIGDDRWDAVPGEYEFDAKEVWALLSRADDRSSKHPADSLLPPPRRRGPVVTHDWFSICGEIARRCIDPKTGRVQVPEKEHALAVEVRKWLKDQDKGQPALSEMREAVKRVCAALRSK
jgi:hypothetical protein